MHAQRLLQDQDLDGIALHYAGSPISFGEMSQRSRRVASALLGLGIGPGDRVAIWLPNTPAWLEVFFACSQIGAVAVSVNTRFRAAEVEDILVRSRARVLLLWPRFLNIDFLEILDEIQATRLDNLERVILYSESSDSEQVDEPMVLGCPGTSYSSLLEHPPREGNSRSDESSEGCIVFTTSGTTKAPKFVLHSQQALVEHAADVGRAFGYERRDVRLAQALPFCGVFGFCQMMAALAAGRPTHLLSHFQAREVNALIERDAITHMHATDDMWRSMFEVAENAQLSTLRAGGFAAFNGQPEDLVGEADRRGVSLVGLYGMSEVQAFFSTRDSETSPVNRARAGGRPVSSTAQVRVRDPATGELLGMGQQGELEVRGPSLMLRYLDDENSTTSAMTDDGFLRTGDLARMEAGGGFEYLARMGDTLRLGGFLVSPAEIEAHLETSPRVASAQVVGVQTDRGPACCAFVLVQEPEAGKLPTGEGTDREYTRNEMIEEELQQHCARSLAKFKVPARIFPIAKFPTTASANGTKIQKAKLRLRAQEAVDASQ